MITPIRENGKIVAYPPGTFPGYKDLAPDLKTFAFSCAEGDREVLVQAVSPELAAHVLGYNNAYEEEWGDYRGLLRELHEGVAKVYLKETTYTEVSIP
jgi:hypothetical protein